MGVRIAALCGGIMLLALIVQSRVESDAVFPENANRIVAGMHFDNVVALLRKSPTAAYRKDEPFEVIIEKMEPFHDREVFWWPRCIVFDRTVEERVVAEAYWEGERGFIHVGFDQHDRAVRVEFRARVAASRTIWDRLLSCR